jgi:putative restriction endonuclease
VHNVAVRGYVGVTDQEWYEFLSSRPDLTEVNFWRPKDQRRFGAIEPGEFFFFKLHAPDNRVVGGGIFVGWELLPLSAAWEVYGEGNGAADFMMLRRKITSYSAADDDPSRDPEIGCVLLRDVVFFPRSNLAAPPPEFPSNLVQGRSYNLDDVRYGTYFGELAARILGAGIGVDINWQLHQGSMFSDPRLRRERLGQKGFQAAMLTVYHRSCAITGTKIWPALQAAHIFPVQAGGEHRIDNGLLLRSDVHTMFDRGYLGVDPDYRLLVSPRLRDEFGNGEQFYAKAGQVIALPDRKAHQPRREYLEWHVDKVFKAS